MPGNNIEVTNGNVTKVVSEELFCDALRQLLANGLPETRKNCIQCKGKWAVLRIGGEGTYLHVEGDGCRMLSDTT